MAAPGFLVKREVVVGFMLFMGLGDIYRCRKNKYEVDNFLLF